MIVKLMGLNYLMSSTIRTFRYGYRKRLKFSTRLNKGNIGVLIMTIIIIDSHDSIIVYIFLVYLHM